MHLFPFGHCRHLRRCRPSFDNARPIARLTRSVRGRCRPSRSRTKERRCQAASSGYYGRHSEASRSCGTGRQRARPISRSSSGAFSSTCRPACCGFFRRTRCQRSSNSGRATSPRRTCRGYRPKGQGLRRTGHAEAAGCRCAKGSRTSAPRTRAAARHLLLQSRSLPRPCWKGQARSDARANHRPAAGGRRFENATRRSPGVVRDHCSGRANRSPATVIFKHIRRAPLRTRNPRLPIPLHLVPRPSGDVSCTPRAIVPEAVCGYARFFPSWGSSVFRLPPSSESSRTCGNYARRPVKAS